MNTLEKNKITLLVKLAIASFVMVLVVSSQLVYAATPSKIDDLAREFICNCGCNKLLKNCEMSCAKKLKKVIAQKIDAGWNKEKIINYMMKTYNEQILAAPTKKGFNLTAWITPFIAIGLGGLSIVAIILVWLKSTQSRQVVIETARPTAGIARKESINEKYKEKLDEELKDFDW